MLLFLMLQAVPALTAEQALAAYGRLTRAPAGDARECAAGAAPGEVVVCGAREAARDRLPLPDERAGPGEVVRHRGEASAATRAFDRGPTGKPSHLMQTVLGIARLVRSAATGQDPGPP